MPRWMNRGTIGRICKNILAPWIWIISAINLIFGLFGPVPFLALITQILKPAIFGGGGVYVLGWWLTGDRDIQFFRI